VFDLMRDYMDGTTSSSLFEARLGHEKFGKETHAYSVGYSRDDILGLRDFADKVIFNSVSQLRMFHKEVKGLKLGLRVNPGISYSHYELADPACHYSRLGVADRKELAEVAHLLSGLMFHFNCENDNFPALSASLDAIGRKYGKVLKSMEWVSLGGGVAFTKDGYPLADFCRRLKQFADDFGVQVYLEPGEAAITQSAELVATVLDVVHNKLPVAVLDVAMEAHLLDHLIYRTSPKITRPAQGGSHRTLLAGRSCLAGDVFGTYDLNRPIKVGDQVRFADAAGYSMVKKNWFNGVRMPAIAVRRLSGSVEVVRRFDYEDFVSQLS